MSTVLIESDGAIRTLTLNRPEKRNALDGDMLAAIVAEFSRTPEPQERAAVIRANGPAFCSGMDLRQRVSGERPGQWASIESAVRAIERYPLPVVAVVQGDAIAGGNELALHCDLVVASSAARFGMPLAQLGLALHWPLVKKLLDTAGPAAARELLLLGDPLPAERMHALGMIARVAPPERLEAEAQAMIARLAANAPLSLRALKAMLLAGQGYHDGIDHADADALAAAARQSADAREGMLARLEHRQPRFTGQ